MEATNANKPASFLWSYNGAPLRNDPVMTRQRAAKMLHAWRSHGYRLTRDHSDGMQRWHVRTGNLLATMAVQL